MPPEAAGLVRYGLEELLRGLGLAPTWTRLDDARLTLRLGGKGKGLDLRLGPEALDPLVRSGMPDRDRLGWTAIDGERWPLPASGPEAGAGDLVASAAWWLAGVQEAGAARDPHGRFPYAASLQARLGDGPGGALRPAVDAYRRALAQRLRAAGVDVLGRTWGGAPWAVALTHDLDALRTRRLRAFGGDLLRGRPALALRRALGPDVRRRSVADLRALADRLGVRATYFAKPGAWAPEDANAPLGRTEAALLRSLQAEGHEVGWHPGYGAHDHAARLGVERDRFEAALGRAPTVARTHFLRWTEPTTPRLLAEAGVWIDSTLGFSAHEGYRRGTSHPFRLYDRRADRPTDLWEAPLAVMDTTLFEHRRLGTEAAAEAIRWVFEAARLGGGCVVVLWHNDLGAREEWSRRLHILDHALGRALENGAMVGPLIRLTESWTGPVR